MKPWVAIFSTILLATGLAPAGCSSQPLTRDQQIQMLMAENVRLQQAADTDQQELARYRQSDVKPAPTPTPPDPFRPVAIRFGAFTGVVNGEAPALEQRLKVVVEPVDASGDVVKRAGSLVLETFEPPSAAGQTPKPYHRWDLSVGDFSQTWLSGLGAYAYILRFPWPDGRPPAGGKLLLRAAMTTLAGETFTAETEIAVPHASGK